MIVGKVFIINKHITLTTVIVYSIVYSRLDMDGGVSRTLRVNTACHGGKIKVFDAICGFMLDTR